MKDMMNQDFWLKLQYIQWQRVKKLLQQTRVLHFTSYLTLLFGRAVQRPWNCSPPSSIVWKPISHYPAKRLQRLALAVNLARNAAVEVWTYITLQESDFLLQYRAINWLEFHSLKHLWAHAFYLQLALFIHHTRVLELCFGFSGHLDWFFYLFDWNLELDAIWERFAHAARTCTTVVYDPLGRIM